MIASMLAGVWLLALLASDVPGILGVPAVDPYKKFAPSGGWELAVEPVERSGTGPSRISVSQGGLLRYERSLPYTFAVAGVTGEGYVFGVARTEWRHCKDGEFIVSVIDPNGDDLWVERMGFASRCGYVGARPDVSDVIVDHNGDWFILCVAGQDRVAGYNEWWRYPIRKLGPREVLLPTLEVVSDPRVARVTSLAAESVPGTSYILSQWGEYREGGAASLIYALLDPDAHVVWDRRFLLHEGGENSLYGRIEILGAHDGGGFGIWDPSTSDYITYRVRGNLSEVSVVEVGRRKSTRKELRGQLEARTLPVSGRSSLAITRKSPLSSFGFDSAGGLVEVRRTGPGSYVSVFFGPEGRTKREVAWETLAGSSPNASTVKIHYVGEVRWVVSVSAPREPSREGWFLVDANTGTQQRLSRIRDPLGGMRVCDITSAAGMPGGDFVALRSLLVGNDLISDLVRCSSKGDVIWSVRSEGNAVTSLADGRVAVLRSSRKRVAMYSPDGAELRVLVVADALEREPRYPTAICAKGLGTILIGDPASDPSLWLLTATGDVVSQFTPTLFGVRERTLARYARFGPDGQVWARDGGGVYIVRDGAATRMPEATLSELEPGNPGDVTVDTFGRIWVADEASAVLYGYDRDGALVCVTEPTSREGRRDMKLVARPGGGVLVGRRRPERFDDVGRSLGFAPSTDGRVAVEIAGDRFVCGEDEGPLRVVGADGRVLNLYEKVPDGTWVGYPVSSAWSVGGRAALLTQREGRGLAVVMLSGNGVPESVRWLPHQIWDPHLSLNDDYAMVSGGGDSALLYSFANDAFERVVFADCDREVLCYSAGLSSDTDEIFVVDSRDYSVRVYSIN